MDEIKCVIILVEYFVNKICKSESVSDVRFVFVWYNKHWSVHRD